MKATFKILFKEEIAAMVVPGADPMERGGQVTIVISQTERLHPWYSETEARTLATQLNADFEEV